MQSLFSEVSKNSLVGARQLASLLIDEKGDLQKEALHRIREELRGGLYCLAPGHDSDCLTFAHIEKCLPLIDEAALRRFSPPLFHKKGEALIRDTLYPEEIPVLTTAHIRRAILVAWLTPLRQITGSCFATAPLIQIQKSQPERFLQDLYDLLTTGELKRVVEGKLFSVPLSPMTPPVNPALRDHLYSSTLEAFCLTEEEIEEEEKRAAALQINPMVGQGYFYQKPTERAEKIALWRKTFEKAARALWCETECALLRAWEYTVASFCDAKTDFARWNLFLGLGLNPEETGGVADFLHAYLTKALEEANRDTSRFHREFEEAASSVRALETLLAQAYTPDQIHRLKGDLTGATYALNLAFELKDKARKKGEAIRDFFPALLSQYDALCQDSFQEIFDPSVAIVQEGLTEDSPAGFRLLYKHGRVKSATWSLIYNEKEYLEVLHEFFSTVEREILLPQGIDPEFFAKLTTELLLFLQMPEFLERARLRAKKAGRLSPWDYVSGGTMQTLLQAYYNLKYPVTELKWYPQGAERLLEHLLEVKKGPYLMHSPTHAFLFRPDLLPKFPQEFLEKDLAFLKAQIFDVEGLEHIIHLASERLPLEERALFIHRARLGEGLAGIQEALGKAEILDSLLFEEMPFLTNQEASAYLQRIDHTLSLPTSQNIWGRGELFSVVKTLLMKTKGLFSKTDWDAVLQKEFPYPHPILFGDTNWSDWFFGLVRNPRTFQLELWRVNRLGTRGIPMHEWRFFLSPENKLPWILLPKSEEYR